MGQVVTVPYTPRRWSSVLHDAVKRWIVLVLHRRAGKTTAIFNHLQRSALTTPDSQYAYVAPTQVQARRIAWDIAKRYSRPIPGVKSNESLLTIEYPNRSKILLLGAENVDSLRGLALWGGGQDESSQQPSNLFSEVISKSLADHLGYWIWAGTPKGRNEFYRTYETARQHQDEWAVLFQTIEETLKTESGETIENLRQALEDDRKLVAQGLMTQEEFEQEWFCSFEAAIKGAYYAKEFALARKQGRFGVVPYDPSLKVWTVWDLGMDDSMAIGFYQKTPGQLHKIDYYEASGHGIEHYVRVLQQKQYIYGGHFAPHDIKVRELGTGVSRWETAKGLGITFKLVPNLPVDDGIQAARLAFSRLWVDEKNCQTWLDYIPQYKKQWNEKRGVYESHPHHDFTSHAADEFRYAALVERLMVSGYDGPRPFHDKTQDIWNNA